MWVGPGKGSPPHSTSLFSIYGEQKGQKGEGKVKLAVGY